MKRAIFSSYVNPIENFCALLFLILLVLYTYFHSLWCQACVILWWWYDHNHIRDSGERTGIISVRAPQWPQGGVCTGGGTPQIRPLLKARILKSLTDRNGFFFTNCDASPNNTIIDWVATSIASLWTCELRWHNYRCVDIWHDTTWMIGSSIECHHVDTKTGSLTNIHKRIELTTICPSMALKN